MQKELGCQVNTRLNWDLLCETLKTDIFVWKERENYRKAEMRDAESIPSFTSNRVDALNYEVGKAPSGVFTR